MRLLMCLCERCFPIFFMIFVHGTKDNSKSDDNISAYNSCVCVLLKNAQK